MKDRMDIVKAYSATVAAQQALEQAAVNWLGLIKRTQDGFYICIPSNEFEIRVTPVADPKDRDLLFVNVTDVKEFVVKVGDGAGPRIKTFPARDFLSSRDLVWNMERADHVTAVMSDGAEYIVKNRDGECTGRLG